MSKNRNTYEKRWREVSKKRKAEEKRGRRVAKKTNVQEPKTNGSAAPHDEPSSPLD